MSWRLLRNEKKIRFYSKFLRTVNTFSSAKGNTRKNLQTAWRRRENLVVVKKVISGGTTCKNILRMKQKKQTAIKNLPGIKSIKTGFLALASSFSYFVHVSLTKKLERRKAFGGGDFSIKGTAEHSTKNSVPVNFEKWTIQPSRNARSREIVKEVKEPLEDYWAAHIFLDYLRLCRCRWDWITVE